MTFDGLPSSWGFGELKNVGVAVLDCEHKTPPDAGEGHPYIAIPNLVDGRLDLSSVRRITDDQLKEWTRRTQPQGGDIIVTRRARVGDSAVVPAGLWCAIGQNLVILRSDGNRVDQRFLRWATRGRLWMHEVDRLRNVGAVFDSLNVRDIARIRIPLPPRAEQERIACVLDALETKIGSNRQLAGLLEETAATLFRALFVDFVGAEDFEDSELGPIPVGWRVGSLVDLAKFVNGKAFTKYGSGAGRPILRIRELNQGVDRQTLRADLHANDVNVAHADDILFAWSGSLGLYRWPGDEALINQHIFKVIPEGTPQWFVHAWIEEHMDWFRSVAAEKATTMGHIQRRHLAEARVAVPASHALEDADRLVGPIDRHRARLVQESRTLTELRDALLPKLISGEIRVPDTSDVAEVIEPVVA